MKFFLLLELVIFYESIPVDGLVGHFAPETGTTNHLFQQEQNSAINHLDVMYLVFITKNFKKKKTFFIYLLYSIYSSFSSLPEVFGIPDGKCFCLLKKQN